METRKSLPRCFVNYICLLYFTTILVSSHIFLGITIFGKQVGDLKAEEVITSLSLLSEYKLCSADVIAEVMLGVLLFKFSRNYNRDLKLVFFNVELWYTLFKLLYREMYLCKVINWIFYFFECKNIWLLHSQSLLALGNICEPFFPQQFTSSGHSIDDIIMHLNDVVWKQKKIANKLAYIIAFFLLDLNTIK